MMFAISSLWIVAVLCSGCGNRDPRNEPTPGWGSAGKVLIGTSGLKRESIMLKNCHFSVPVTAPQYPTGSNVECKLYMVNWLPPADWFTSLSYEFTDINNVTISEGPIVVPAFVPGTWVPITFGPVPLRMDDISVVAN